LGIPYDVKEDLEGFEGEFVRVGKIAHEYDTLDMRERFKKIWIFGQVRGVGRREILELAKEEIEDILRNTASERCISGPLSHTPQSMQD
jgi:hypothetical protein